VKLPLLIILIFLVLFLPHWGLQAAALFIFAVVGLAYLYARLARRALRIERRECVLRGHRLETMYIRILIENQSAIPIHFFVLRDHDAGLGVDTPQLFLGLGPWQKTEFSYRIESRVRGEFHLGPIVARGGDPLGLFHWHKRVPAALRVVIYPRMHRLELPNRRGLPAGNLPTPDRIYEDVTRYRSLREYIPGDDVRRIHWKASARLGSLHTVEYVPALFFPLVVLLNLSLEDYPERNRYSLVERAVEMAASLIAHFIDLDQEVGLISSGSLAASGSVREESPTTPVVVAPAGRYAQAVALLEVLARIAPTQGNASFGSLLQGGTRLATGTRLCVVSPRPSGEQALSLHAVRRRTSAVEIFMIAGGARRTTGGGPVVYRVRDYGEEMIERV
jgi:uncharacterized protein (DUF58 family)